MKKLIGMSSIRLSKVEVGLHIRPYELSKALGIKVYHERFRRRTIEHLRNFFHRHNILLFGYVFSDPEVTMLRTQRSLGSKVFLDIADIPYLKKYLFNMVPYNYWESRRSKFMRLIETSDALLFVSIGLRELAKNFLGRIVDDKPSLVVPNAANPDHFRVTQLPLKEVVLYVGGHEPARGYDILIEAFNLVSLNRKKLQLRIISSGISDLMRAGTRKNIVIERDKFYWDMPKIFSETFVSVIPHRKNPYMNTALPVKLFDSMASARPLVATKCNEVAQLVSKERCGVVVEDNPKSLAEGIEYIIDNREEAWEMGLRGREAVEKRHSWRHRAETISDYIQSL